MASCNVAQQHLLFHLKWAMPEKGNIRHSLDWLSSVNDHFEWEKKAVRFLMDFSPITILIWAVAGILVSVKTREQQKLHKLKESYDHLVQRVTELQELADKLVSPCTENEDFPITLTKAKARCNEIKTVWRLWNVLYVANVWLGVERMCSNMC